MKGALLAGALALAVAIAWLWFRAAPVQEPSIGVDSTRAESAPADSPGATSTLTESTPVDRMPTARSEADARVSLRGRCVSAASGAPLAGCELRVHAKGQDAPIAEQTTAADGAFERTPMLDVLIFTPPTRFTGGDV